MYVRTFVWSCKRIADNSHTIYYRKFSFVHLKKKILISLCLVQYEGVELHLIKILPIVILYPSSFVCGFYTQLENHTILMIHKCEYVFKYLGQHHVKTTNFPNLAHTLGCSLDHGISFILHHLKV